MAKKIRAKEDGYFLAVIGDEDTVTGFLLTGVGHVDIKRKTNFFVVDSKTKQIEIENAFREFCAREDIAIILINQHIADDIRYLIDEFNQVVPTLLEIPSKDHPFDASKDFIMARLNKMMTVEPGQ